MEGSPSSACMEAILRSKNVLVTGHERPDPDCFGSQIGLVDSLRSLGLNARAVSSDPAPVRFPPGLGEGLVSVYSPGDDLSTDCLVVLDTTELSRTGRIAPHLPQGAQIVNVDHHISNTAFGTVNWVDPGASAVGEMVYEALCGAGVPIPLRALRALYSAIVADTGQFSYANTTPKSLRAAAEMIEKGVDPEAIWRELYMNRSRAELDLENRARASLEMFCDGRIAAISITNRDFRDAGLGPEATQDFANIPRLPSGAILSLYFYEIEDGRKTKISLRSTRDVDVNVLAREHGGGGHAQAAGCLIEGPLAEAKAKFIRGVEARIRALEVGPSAAPGAACAPRIEVPAAGRRGVK